MDASDYDNSDILQVRVMDWITDSPLEQQAHVETTRSFSRIRHLEIRLTGWTINQNRRVHVGINTVPAVLGVLITNATMEELTIDLECLSSQKKALSTFCNLVTTRDYYASLAKLTILCSGEEDASRYSLRYLGRALRNLSSVKTLKIVGMNPDHLAVVLNSMKKSGESCLADCLPSVAACCPCISKDSDGNGRPCPRILPVCCCDPYQAVPVINCNGDEEMITIQVPNHNDNNAEDTDEEVCPQKLELHRIRLSNKAISTLAYLLLDASQSSVTKLTLRECLQSTEDIGFLAFLCQGHSVLQELTLERHQIRSISPDEASPWWNPCANRVPNPTAATRRHRRLKVCRLLDCEGARKVLEEVTGSLLVRNNEGLQRLVLQYSSMETCSMTIHALNTLYVETVIRNKPSHLLELQVVSTSPQIPPESSYRLHQLAAILGHPLCSLQTLQLHLGRSPYYQLDILGERLIDNNSLKHLSLSGDDAINVTTLGCFVSMLDRIPKLTSLKLDFPGFDEDENGDCSANEDDANSDEKADETLLDIFEANITLEDIRIEGNNDNSHIHLSFMGLRNRIRKVLAARQSCQVTRATLWKDILQIILTWCESSQAQKRLTLKGQDLVVTSGLWFALVECPLMVVEMEAPLLLRHQATADDFS